MFSSCLDTQTRRRGLSFHTETASNRRLRAIDKINLALLVLHLEESTGGGFIAPPCSHILCRLPRKKIDGRRLTSSKVDRFLCFHIE
jgi:hypothetical protein